MAKRRLIINADGFGFTFGNNSAIFDTIRAGTVKSISVNTTFPAIADVDRVVAEHPGVSIGIHFNLAVGRPASDPALVSSLVGPDGNFLDARWKKALLTGLIKPDHIRRELTAQLNILLQRGIVPTHWDGHRNQHLFPIYFDIAMDVARHAGIERMRTNHHHLFLGDNSDLSAVYYARHPDRWLRHRATSLWMIRGRLAGFRMADRMITPIVAGPDTRKTDRRMWEALFRRLPAGTYEIYCHPGYVDDDLRRHAKYVDEREAEALVLSDPSLAVAARSAGVELISFFEV